MAVELASGYLSLSVKLDGATKGLGNLFDKAQKQALDAGKKTGEAYTKGLEAEYKKANDQVSKFVASQKKALDKEADASDKTRVALERLNEARDGGVTGSRLTQLQTQHESLMRKEAAAANELARETDALTQAQKRQERAQASLNDNLNNPAKKSGRFRNMWAQAGEDAEAAGANAAGRFSSGFSQAAKTAGALALGGGIIASISKIATVGLDFEKTMNTLSGVTGASADQMQRLRDTAKALGNDVTLSSTSAADAALAMTELAKAGFSVDDAMAAAKGTLQLAAAAQIDAGQAAEIQANALQAFGLNADYASKAADVLSNAANASSAEITDVAYAMQSGGAVARQTGVSFEDTAAAIALMANNGIKGSDAGTLLKSALLKLAAPSDGAAGALEALGVNAWDAQGKFIGLPALFGQLQNAAKTMTPEMYAFNTATAFGSDAARLAGIAAKDGATGFNAMRDAMNKQGSASELAAAQNQGWPGVIERIKNSFETLSITLFGSADPFKVLGDGLTAVINKMNDVFSNEAVKSGIKATIEGIGSIIGFVNRYKEVLLPLVAGWVAYKVAVFAVALPLKIATAAQVALNAAMLLNPIALVVAAIAALIAGIVLLYKHNETFRNIVNGAWAAIKVAISAVWGWITNTVVPGLKAAWDVIATGATWLWQNAIQPAWEGIKAVIGFAWEIISDIFHNWQVAMGLVGTVATALWQTYIAPAWEGIKTAFKAAWDFISPIFDNVKNAFTSTGNFIKGVWNGVASVIKSAFDGIVNAIKPGLHILGNMLAAIPTNLGPFEIPGADTARSWGQKLQAFRGGGKVTGPGTGTSDSILAWLSNGEGVVTAQGMQNGGGALVAALNAGWTPPVDMLKAMVPGLPGFAEGLNPGADYLRTTVMKLWPQITSIGGRRAEDGFGEHSSGNALDIMIPGYDSAQGLALGNAVLAFLQENGSALDVDGIIWRQTSYGYGHGLTSGQGMKDRGSPTQNHMDHVHVILGKGRRAGAAPTAVPTSSLKLPTGVTSSVTPNASALSSGGGTGGTRAATPKQLREAGDRVTDLENRLDIAQQELDKVNADPKAKDTSKQRKQDQVDKLSRDLQQAKDDKTELESRVDSPGTSSSSSSGRNSGSDPFSKIMDGFGELANTAVGGLKENLPEGFSDPTQWGLMQMGGGLLNFFSGLTPDPVARGILGAFGSGLTGDAGGAVKSLGGIFQPAQLNADMQNTQLAPGQGLMPPDGAHAGSGAAPGPQLPGVTVNAGAADARQVGNIVNNQYQPAVRRQFATTRP